MPDTNITPVEGFAAGMNQRALDDQKVLRAPLETELLRAHAGEATLKLQNQQKMMQAMAQYGAGQAKQGDTIADRADFIGDLYLKSGMPEAGLKAMNYATLARARAATAQAASTRAVLNQSKTLVQDLDTYERYMNGSGSQADFDQRNALYFANTGKIGMLAGHTWSPETMKEFTAQTLGAKDRLNLAMRDQENTSRDDLRRRRIEEMDTLDAYRDWRKGFLARQQDWREKHGGGKAVASPNNPEQLEATRLIKRDYPELYGRDKEEVQTAAFAIASRARELRLQNPAKGANEAIAEAYTEAIKAGDFKHTEGRTMLQAITGVAKGEFRGTKDAETKYLGAGKTAATAMRLPADPTKYEKGKFYISPKTGQVAQFTGTGFSPVAEDEDNQDDIDDSGDEE